MIAVLCNITLGILGLHQSAGNGVQKKRKWTFDDLHLEEAKVGLNGSPTWVEKVFTPTMEKKTMMLEGEPEEVTQKLAEYLKELC